MSRTPGGSRRPARRLLSPLAVLAIGAVVLAGCGKESDNGDSESTGSPESGVAESGAAGSSESPETAETEGTEETADVEGTFVDPAGAEVGTFTMTGAEDGVEVFVEVSGLSEGFHGIHVHQTGVCEPASPDPADPQKVGDFLSAGGHLAEEGQQHGEHAGDLPALAVGADGVGTLQFVTDALTLEEVQDADGSAVMVHAGRDNYANIPERYASQGPDADTLKTGDSGDRVACGVVPAA